jgi:hypothetical protein
VFDEESVEVSEIELANSAVGGEDHKIYSKYWNWVQKVL